MLPLSSSNNDDRGLAVVAVSYTFLGLSALFTSLRYARAYFLGRRYGWDDLFVLLALAVCLSQSVLVEDAQTNGLGRHQNTLSNAELHKYFKYAYSPEILAIVSMFFAKLSVVYFITRLSPQTSLIRRGCATIYISIFTWFLLSLFGLVFQCPLPNLSTYSPSRCAGSGAIWYPIIVLNILTDIALPCLIVPILPSFELSPSQRLISSILFFSRLLVIPLSIAQLTLLAPALKSPDQTSTRTTPVILQQLVLNLSLITATLPTLYRPLSSNLRTFQSHPQPPTTTIHHDPRRMSTITTTGIDGLPTRKTIIDFRPDLLERTRNEIVYDPTAFSSVHFEGKTDKISSSSGKSPVVNSSVSARSADSRGGSAAGLEEEEEGGGVIRTMRTFSVTYDERIRIPP